MPSANTPSPRPLRPAEFHILLVLSGEDLHGYGIMQAVRSQSGGEVELELGSLYRIIARLSAEGLIAETRPRSSPDQRRRYYRITPAGRVTASREARRLDRVVRLARARQLLSRPVSG